MTIQEYWDRRRELESTLPEVAVIFDPATGRATRAARNAAAVAIANCGCRLATPEEEATVVADEARAATLERAGAALARTGLLIVAGPPEAPGAPAPDPPPESQPEEIQGDPPPEESQGIETAAPEPEELQGFASAQAPEETQGFAAAASESASAQDPEPEQVQAPRTKSKKNKEI